MENDLPILVARVLLATLFPAARHRGRRPLRADR
jgi:hypothetical protein